MKNIFNAVKRICLRLFARQARPMMIYYRRNFQGERCENVRISSSTFLDGKKNLKISNHCYIGHHGFIEANNGVEIGEGVQLGAFCTVVSHSSHNSIRYYGAKYSETKDPIGYVKGQVKIGKYTFVGPYTTIMPNTTIGKGCLIGGYSYLNGKYPDFSIVIGNPGKVIGNTQKLDEKVLNQHPELKAYYQEWANE